MKDGDYMDPMKKIYRDMKNRIRSVLPNIADEISDKMVQKYADCVQAFYEHMPESINYDRTFSTFLGSSATCSYEESSSGSMRNQEGETTTFTVHVNLHVDPSYLGEPYRDPTDYVFERTWGKGIHGNYANLPMRPSPETLFDAWYKDFKNPKTGEARAIANRYMIKIGLGSE